MNLWILLAVTADVVEHVSLFSDREKAKSFAQQSHSESLKWVEMVGVVGGGFLAETPRKIYYVVERETDADLFLGGAI